MNISNNTLIYSHENLTRWLSSTLSPIILFGCAFGNTISFLILLRPRLRRQTTSVYLAMLCITEIGTCYTGLLRQFLLDAFNIDIRRINSFTCRTHIYLTYVFLRLAPLLLALVTLQRYLYVSQRAICSLKSTMMQIFCLLLFVSTAELHLFVFYDFTYPDILPRSEHMPFECTVNKFHYKKYYKFRSTIYPKLALLAYTIVPLAIIVIGNILLVRTVKRASERSKSKAKKKRSVTRMLYAVCVLYAVLTSPASIFLAIAPASYQLAPAFRLQWTLLRLLFYLCHSVNFLLFCACGTIFRQEFVTFLNSYCGFHIRWKNYHRRSGDCGDLTIFEEETVNQGLRYKPASNRCRIKSEKTTLS